MKKKRCDTLRIIFILAFIIYMFSVFYITVLSRVPEERRVDMSPFRSYIFLIRDKNYFYLKQIALNILMTIPFGIIVPALWKNLRSFYKIIIRGFIFSFIIEITQFITARGLFEFDDLINNTIGSILGYIIYILVHNKIINLIDKL